METSAPAAERREMQLTGSGTFIGEGAEFEGTLRVRNAIRLNGEFRGEIVSDCSVVVRESAGIEANIRAREVFIAGAVVGNVTASRQLTIRAGGRLHGDVETPCLEVEKGAFFNGQTTMARPEAVIRAGTQQATAQATPASGPPQQATGWKQLAVSSPEAPPAPGATASTRGSKLPALQRPA